ncbi:MAG: hypothetical protein OXC07_06090 [Kistimonas sp.]|nr:hypothetical protein [Kistimonas sp.]
MLDQLSCLDNHGNAHRAIFTWSPTRLHCWSTSSPRECAGFSLFEFHLLLLQFLSIVPDPFRQASCCVLLKGCSCLILPRRFFIPPPQTPASDSVRQAESVDFLYRAGLPRVLQQSRPVFATAALSLSPASPSATP